MTNTQVLVTRQGLEQLQAELRELKEVKRPALVERLSIARSMGDLSENSDYISAKEDLAFMDGRIDELEQMIQDSKVFEPKSADKVDFGHTVKVKLKSNEITFHIVGEPEADPTQRKISHSSPLGQALLGKKVGDEVEVEAPVGKISYTILSIG